LTKRIIVDGCYLKATRNLYSALRQLRYLDKDRILWIDAICIDQKDMKERGHQVEQMSKIYCEAESVIFWLGLGTVETDMVMESLRHLHHESLNHNARDWSFQDDRWTNLWTRTAVAAEKSHKDSIPLLRQGLRELLARPWFRRVWILQEVALAKAGIIICGRRSVSAKLLGLFPMFLDIEPDTHCQSILDIMPSPWRKTSWWSKSPDLRALLVHFGDSEATESRDLVYALRGMASDAAGKNDITPDYDKPEEDLVREVVRLVEHCELEELALETPPRTVRDLIKCLRALSLDRCMDLARRSLPRDMEMYLKKSKIRVNQQMIITAAENDKTGEVVEVLLRYRPKGFMVNNRVWAAAAKNATGPKGIFEALLRHQGQIKISDEMLMAAAKNESCGDEAFEAIVSYQRDHIKITDEMLIAAAENEGCGNKIFNSLSRSKKYDFEISYEVLTAAAKNAQYGDGILESLFRYTSKLSDKVVEAATRNAQGGNGMLTFILSSENSPSFRQQQLESKSRGLLEIAAANEACGDTLINILLSHKPSPDIISAEAVTAAAKNKWHGNKVMGILLSYNPKPDIISAEAVTAAAKNYSYGNKVMDILLSYNPSPDIISAEAITAAAKNEWHSNRVIKILLSYNPSPDIILAEAVTAAVKNSLYGNKVMVSAEAFTAATKNEWHGNRVIKILLSYNPSPDIISAEAITAAAKNKWYGNRVIEILLSYNPSPDIILAEAVTAAAKNYSYDNKVIDILLSYNPSPDIISAEAVIAAAKNYSYDNKVMDILLSYNPSPDIISAEAVTAAAKNEWHGNKVIKILLSYNPSPDIISAEAITAAAKNEWYGKEILQIFRSYGTRC
jgi:hypothetical protein